MADFQTLRMTSLLNNVRYGRKSGRWEKPGVFVDLSLVASALRSLESGKAANRFQWAAIGLRQVRIDAEMKNGAHQGSVTHVNHAVVACHDHSLACVTDVDPADYAAVRRVDR